MPIELEPIIQTLIDTGYTSNTPAELADLIGLAFADFDGGEDRFQAAIDTAGHEIIFRLGSFGDNSYPEISPIDDVKLQAARGLAQSPSGTEQGRSSTATRLSLSCSSESRATHSQRRTDSTSVHSRPRKMFKPLTTTAEQTSFKSNSSRSFD